MSPAVPRPASRTQPVWEELPSFTSISPGESLPLMELAPGCLGCSQHFAAASMLQQSHVCWGLPRVGWCIYGRGTTGSKARGRDR